MSKLDLGIDKIEYNECEKWSWTTTTKVDDVYIAKVKAKIIKQLGNNKYNILYIKHIKTYKEQEQYLCATDFENDNLI